MERSSPSVRLNEKLPTKIFFIVDPSCLLGIDVLSGNRQDDGQGDVSITVEDGEIITGKKTVLHPKSSRVAQIGVFPAAQTSPAATHII
jgi:hypothetical protein